MISMKKNNNRFLLAVMMVLVSFGFYQCANQNQKTESKEATNGIWSVEKANEWYKKWGWLRGCDFIPSTAINQLEMWQAETFDTATINRELGLAESIGMNIMRVYLHHAAWEIDKDGFKKRMATYLDIAERHGINTLFVFFDDCWNATYQTGTQPAPKPGVHNSGWVQDPGNLYNEDTTLVNVLEDYVKDVLTTFKDDKRIV